MRLQRGLGLLSDIGHVQTTQLFREYTLCRFADYLSIGFHLAKRSNGHSSHFEDDSSLQKATTSARSLNAR